MSAHTNDVTNTRKVRRPVGFGRLLFRNLIALVGFLSILGVAASKSSADQITPANFQDYFSWKSGTATSWKTGSSAITKTNNLSSLATASYNFYNNIGTVSFTSNQPSQLGMAALTSAKIDLRYSFSISGNLNLGKLGGADGVSFGFYPGDIESTGVQGADIGIGGLRGAFGWSGDTYYNGASSTDPVYTLGNGTKGPDGGLKSDLTDYTSRYGGDSGTFASAIASGNAAIGGWSFADQFPIHDVTGITGPKVAYDNLDSPQQLITSFLSTSANNYVPFSLGYTPGNNSLNQGILTVSYGPKSTTVTTKRVTYQTADPRTSGITTTSSVSNFKATNSLASFTYTSGNVTMQGSFTQGTATISRRTNTTCYQISTGAATTTDPYSWTIPITTLETLAGDVTYDSSNNPIYPSALSFFMTGSTGGSTNLQQFQMDSTSFMSYTPAPGSVVVHYIDASGNTIAPNTISSGAVGTGYTITAAPITGYNTPVQATALNNSGKIVSAPATGNYTINDINVYYVYTPNTEKISYWDDTTGKELKNVTLAYPTDSSYSTSGQISTYLAQGYTLVSDDTSGKNLFASNNQTYTVHLAHSYTSSLKTVTETINYLDNSSASTPKSSLANQSSKVNTLTFFILTDNVSVGSGTHYYYKIGAQSAPAYSTTGSTAGQVTDTNWTSLSKTASSWQISAGNYVAFNSVSDPNVAGFVIDHTDIIVGTNTITTDSNVSTVAVQTVNLNQDSITVNVYYDPLTMIQNNKTISRWINYVDANDQSIVVSDRVQQALIYHSYRIQNSVTKVYLGYSNGNWTVVSPNETWYADANNSKTDVVSPDLTSKGYGTPSLSPVPALTATPSDPLPGDVTVTYNLGGQNIKLPFTGGHGLTQLIALALGFLVLAGLSFWYNLHRKKAQG